MKCSFAKMSTKGTFEPIWPYGTDLYGRFLYLESGTERVLIAAFDLSGSPARRRAGGAKSPAGQNSAIRVVYELQIHAAPAYEQMAGKAMDALIERSVRHRADRPRGGVRLLCVNAIWGRNLPLTVSNMWRDSAA
ncbi:MAG: hypothetical protein ACLUFV_01730 [Acutalibacteraceae bacterium]